MGGDSLDENFLIGSDSESTVSLSHRNPKKVPSINGDISESGDFENSSVEDSESELDDSPLPATKKSKLNWREGAIDNDGSPESQRKILSNLLVAVGKYYPAHTTRIDVSDLERLKFIDCRDFVAETNRSVADMLSFLHDRNDLLGKRQVDGIRTIIVCGSASRAMFLVKELRQYDSKLAPLPLFFHGGGRKKEQAKTHEAVIKGKKTSVVVALPSRLHAASQQGLIDFEDVELILIDLKQNEKKLNVLSQKETLVDVTEVLERFIIPRASNQLKLALI